MASLCFTVSLIVLQSYLSITRVMCNACAWLRHARSPSELLLKTLSLIFSDRIRWRQMMRNMKMISLHYFFGGTSCDVDASCLVKGKTVLPHVCAIVTLKCDEVLIHRNPTFWRSSWRQDCIANRYRNAGQLTMHIWLVWKIIYCRY